ncbi:hypothetical protein ITP53_33105 [Nonomuraea sp. K274]|uniref:Uncharacterized protein n=1 Tax=Nonomuraea cypriaca TaxID=1187855 RepID=A0A931AF57_9ACTN|nr:hypothetical protein [Nonomuraea cypriaca]MBF8190470.1 hypothetical protein [Nonomuraea cypriaca]
MYRRSSSASGLPAGFISVSVEPGWTTFAVMPRPVRPEAVWPTSSAPLAAPLLAHRMRDRGVAVERVKSALDELLDGLAG